MNPGDRVELTTSTDECCRFTLTAGDLGTVRFADSLGTIQVMWDCGMRVGILVEDKELIRSVGWPSGRACVHGRACAARLDPRGKLALTI
jgi:hypothetical protein